MRTKTDERQRASPAGTGRASHASEPDGREVYGVPSGAGLRKMSSETGRTPGSEAGCNKPAVLEREQTVEVVRNGEDGTSEVGGTTSPKARQQLAVAESGVDRTRGDDGGAIFGIPREVGRRTRCSARLTSSRAKAACRCRQELETVLQQPREDSEQSECACGGHRRRRQRARGPASTSDT